MQLERTHAGGIECLIEVNEKGCVITIHLSKSGESPTSILVVREYPLEKAKDFADDLVQKKGHRCTPACTDWKEF